MIATKYKDTLRAGLAAFAVLGMAGSSFAAEDPITLVHKQLLDKVTTVAGKTTHEIVDPSVTHDKVVPGSHIVVSLQYHNNLSQPIDNFAYTDPLPAPLLLADDSASQFDVSVDGGKTFGKLATLTFTDAKGGKRAAEAGDVTAVRIVVPHIAAGGSGTIEFHATVR